MSCDKTDFEFDTAWELKRPYSRLRIWISSDDLDSLWDTVGLPGALAPSAKDKAKTWLKNTFPKLASRIPVGMLALAASALALQVYAMRQIDDGCGVIWTFYHATGPVPVPASTVRAQ